MAQNEVKTLAETIFVSITPRIILVFFLILSLSLLSKFLKKNEVKHASAGFLAYAFFISKEVLVSISEVLQDITILILRPIVQNAQKTGKDFESIVSTWDTFSKYNILYFIALIVFIVIVLILKPSSKDAIKNEEKELKSDDKSNEVKELKSDDKSDEEKELKSDDKSDEEKELKSDDNSKEEKELKSDDKSDEEKELKSEDKEEK